MNLPAIPIQETTTVYWENTYVGADYIVKKRLTFFPSPAGMSLTKLSLAGTNLIFPGQGKFG